jgi:hypothetical protein
VSDVNLSQLLVLKLQSLEAVGLKYSHMVIHPTADTM